MFDAQTHIYQLQGIFFICFGSQFEVYGHIAQNIYILQLNLLF